MNNYTFYYIVPLEKSFDVDIDQLAEILIQENPEKSVSDIIDEFGICIDYYLDRLDFPDLDELDNEVFGMIYKELKPNLEEILHTLL